MPIALIVHGGAWNIPDSGVEASREGVQAALTLGWHALSEGASALDVVEMTVRALEDDPHFDAGRGSRLIGATLRTELTLPADALVLLTAPAKAAILPEDRTDVLYHGYEGGGLKVDGPSVLVRKAYKDKFSFWGNYYVDMITSASIDVVTTASPYTEERKEFSLGMDYLHGKTNMGASRSPWRSLRASSAALCSTLARARAMRS